MPFDINSAVPVDSANEGTDKGFYIPEGSATRSLPTTTPSEDTPTSGLPYKDWANRHPVQDALLKFHNEKYSEAMRLLRNDDYMKAFLPSMEAGASKYAGIAAMIYDDVSDKAHKYAKKVTGLFDDQ